MSKLVLVGGEISPLLWWSRILLPVGFPLAVLILQFGDLGVGILLTATFGLCWIWTLVYSSWLKARQSWIRDTENGFDVVSRQREIHIEDASLRSMAMRHSRRLIRGELRSILRQVTLWADQSSDPIVLVSNLKARGKDPLAELITRIRNNLVTRAVLNLNAGGLLVGDGWDLGPQYFTWDVDNLVHSLKREEISACRQELDQVTIMREGSAESIATLSTAGRNTCLLPYLLQSSYEPPAEFDNDGSALGRILFERRPYSTYRLLGYVGGGVLIAGGIALLLNGEGLGTSFLYVGVPCVVWACWTGFTVYRCREHGVQQIGLLGVRELHYVDIATFTYSATRYYQNGIYTGTRIGLHFKPLPEARARNVNFCFTIMNEDREINNLRDSIAKIIAHRMRSQLAAGETVFWTGNLAFTREAILYRPKGIVGRKELQRLPYDQYGGQCIEDGNFYLFRLDNEKFIMSEEVSALNFFPGYFLLLLLQDR